MTAVQIGRALVIVGALAAGGAAARGDEIRPDGSGRFRSMLERPLFSPTRRPPPPARPPVVQPVEAAPVPASPPPDLVLSGIILGGGRAVALLHRSQDLSALRVALGGEVDGWTVAEIRPRTMILRQGARSVTLDLPTPGR